MVASVTAIDAAFIASVDHIGGGVARLVSTALISLALLWGVVFVWLRHGAYYYYRDALADLLKDETYLPLDMRRHANRRTAQAQSGVVVFSLWIVFSSVLAIVILWHTEDLTRRWSERRTAVRSTFEMISTLPFRATRCSVRRRSSCSR
jgi:hypothetical protein